MEVASGRVDVGVPERSLDQVNRCTPVEGMLSVIKTVLLNPLRYLAPFIPVMQTTEARQPEHPTEGIRT